MSNKCKFFLITGFLGSGKTTLLKRILEQYADTMRIGVIQNEFAPANVDGKELSNCNKKFEILEINNGSVFCVCLLSDFVSSLQNFIDTYQPEVLFLEATGLADPIALAQLLQAPELRERLYLAQVWTVIDASTFLTMAHHLVRIQHQIRVADIVLVNKTDLGDYNREELRKRVAELNPFAELRDTIFCKTELSSLLCEKEYPVAYRREQEHRTFESGRRPDLQSAVIRTTNPVSSDAVEDFIQRYQSRVIRMKGFVHLDDGSAVAIQSCFGKTTVVSISDFNGPTEIVAMGHTIDNKKFNDDFSMLGKVTV